MGRIHQWTMDARITVDKKLEYERAYYLELRAEDDEMAVLRFWDDRTAHPDFIVAPDKGDSRTNSVVGANIRRITKDNTPIAVMVRGRRRRERLDMTHWLIENDYLPMFPRFMPVDETIPLTRHQVLHEMRPVLDREPDWIFVLNDFRLDTETVAMEYIRGTDNNWELLL